MAQAQGIDPSAVTLPEAAEELISRLERSRRESQSLDQHAVEFAAVLVQMLGSLGVNGLDPSWENAQPLIVRALARRTARFLNRQLENVGFTRPTEQPSPEPMIEEPAEVTLYDLVRTLQKAMDSARALAEKHRSSLPEQP